MSDPNPLYQWCVDTIGEAECESLDKGTENTELDLSDLLSKELQGTSEDDIIREIAEKLRGIIMARFSSTSYRFITEMFMVQLKTEYHYYI